jgi:hypothetical protein
VALVSGADPLIRRPKPVQKPFYGPGRDDPFRGHPHTLGPLGPILEEVELARSVRIAVDAEKAPCLQGELHKVVRWVLAFRPGIDLDGDARLRARCEHPLGVEL